MVNFGSIPRFLLTQRHFGYRTGPSMFVLYQFLFYLYIQKAEAYMGQARMLRKNCTQRQNENEKRTKTTGNREPSQTVLARRRRERLGRWSIWKNSGISAAMDWQRRARALLLPRSFFFCTHVPKIPPARAECISQPSGYNHHEAQAFLAQYTIKPTGDWRCEHPLGPEQARAFACPPTAGPAEITRRRPRTALPAYDLGSRWHCAMTPGPNLCR